MRVGEACALHWDDVDLEARVVTITATASRTPGVGIERGAPKTAASARTIQLPAAAVAVLQNRRRDSERVFTAPKGGYLDPSWVTSLLREREAELGFPGLRSHTFRRTVATFLDDSGLSARQIADALGHQDVGVTLRHYIQADRSSRKAADALDALTESAG